MHAAVLIGLTSLLVMQPKQVYFVIPDQPQNQESTPEIQVLLRAIDKARSLMAADAQRVSFEGPLSPAQATNIIKSAEVSMRCSASDTKCLRVGFSRENSGEYRLISVSAGGVDWPIYQHPKDGLALTLASVVGAVAVGKERTIGGVGPCGLVNLSNDQGNPSYYAVCDRIAEGGEYLLLAQTREQWDRIRSWFEFVRDSVDIELGSSWKSIDIVSVRELAIAAVSLKSPKISLRRRAGTNQQQWLKANLTLLEQGTIQPLELGSAQDDVRFVPTDGTCTDEHTVFLGLLQAKRDSTSLDEFKVTCKQGQVVGKATARLGQATALITRIDRLVDAMPAVNFGPAPCINLGNYPTDVTIRASFIGTGTDPALYELKKLRFIFPGPLAEALSSLHGSLAFQSNQCFPDANGGVSPVGFECSNFPSPILKSSFDSLHATLRLPLNICSAVSKNLQTSTSLVLGIPN